MQHVLQWLILDENFISQGLHLSEACILAQRSDKSWYPIPYSDIIWTSWHLQLDYLFSSLFKLMKMKNIEAFNKWPYVKGIDQWPADPPNKAPVILKVFPFHDIIMTWLHFIYYQKTVILLYPFFIS